MPKQLYLSLVLLLAAAPAWPQTANPAAAPAPVETGVETSREDRMLTPPPVSGEAYSVALDSEERSNYLRYGVAFTSAYSDNVLGGGSGQPVSDVSYSVAPTIALDQTTSRLHWGVTYAPGFTFYQRTGGRNEADQNALFSFQYRLSPHVTFSARDTFQRSSNAWNQPNVSLGLVSGGAQGPNDSVVAPLADRLSNFGTVGLTDQFTASDMVGASGSFSNLHYPTAAQVPGLSDASSQGGSAFYSHRVSRQHYLGATYQYQRLLSYPGGLDNETQTHAVFFFYTFYPAPRVSLSFFGGPQSSATAQPGQTVMSSRNWAPAGGASLNWQSRLTGAALSYSHTVSEGGGLIGAVRLDNASATLRRQFTRTFDGSLAGYYANNRVLETSLLSNNGHTISATAALAHRVGEHLSLQLGYTRLHQSYNIPLIAGAPNTNREFISLSYDFARPLGR